MMDPTVRLVDPVDAAADAAAVLRAAWRPPCLHYSGAYIRWQMTFPGSLPARLALASSDHRAIGCAGLTPREFTLNGARIPGYVLSFVAVDPDSRGKGLAARLYETLLDRIPPEVPILVFTQPDSIGERVLLRACAAAFTHLPLRPCRAVGFVSTGAFPDDGASAREATEAEFIEAMQADTTGGVLGNAPAASILRHYLNDPRPRSLLVLVSPTGNLVGAAMRVAVDMITGSALQRVPMLDNVWIAGSVPSLLRSALSAAGELVPGATVIAPNLSHIGDAMIKATRARSMPSVYNAHLFHGRGALRVDATNVEVI